MSTRNSHSLPLAYLDHNVLDEIIKNRANDFKSWLITSPITLVISNTNLLEIKMSHGYEDEFINLLDQINVRFIEEVIDDRIISTDECRVYETNGAGLKAHMKLVPDEGAGPPTGFGGMIHKLFGGQPSTSFQEILGKQMNDIHQESESELSLENGSIYSEKIKLLTELSLITARGAMEQLGELMDSEKLKQEMAKFQEYQQSAPRVINNLDGDNVIEEVIQRAGEIFDNIEDTGVNILKTLDQFSTNTFGKGSTLGEKIRSLYHLLTLLGYQREPIIKKDAGYRKDMRDVAHLAISRFCRLFFTNDKRLIKKANPIYQYLNLATYALTPSQSPEIVFSGPE